MEAPHLFLEITINQDLFQGLIPLGFQSLNIRINQESKFSRPDLGEQDRCSTDIYQSSKPTRCLFSNFAFE